MGEAGLAICSRGGYKCCKWLDATEREECNGTKIIFIAQSMQKLVTRTMWSTQREQTIIINTVGPFLKVWLNNCVLRFCLHCEFNDCAR